MVLTLESLGKCVKCVMVSAFLHWAVIDGAICVMSHKFQEWNPLDESYAKIN